ncbi:hypothetical protein [Embleya sp. NPDC005971]|uniref:hypothetical protein n=1 Tax=Embleya sp. NPDC005971 TaxID=3156724 RepID=UPI0033D71861
MDETLTREDVYLYVIRNLAPLATGMHAAYLELAALAAPHLPEGIRAEMAEHVAKVSREFIAEVDSVSGVMPKPKEHA